MQIWRMTQKGSDTSCYGLQEKVNDGLRGRERGGMGTEGDQFQSVRKEATPLLKRALEKLLSYTGTGRSFNKSSTSIWRNPRLLELGGKGEREEFQRGDT